MSIDATLEIQAKVRTGTQRVVDSFRHPRERLAAARYLATMGWLSTASAMADKVIVQYRHEHPDLTYEQTADALHIHPSTINRAISRHNKRRQ